LKQGRVLLAMVCRARVRGIYSTALSKILIDNGIELVDVIQVIANRLKVKEKRGLPADVTIKSDEENPSQILVLGFPKAVDKVLNILISEIPEVLTYVAKIGLYSAFKAEIKGFINHTCIVRTPIGEAILLDEESCIKGKYLPVTTIKVPLKPGEKLLVSSRLRAVGRYAIVGRGANVSFSSFIRNKDRISKLLEISSPMINQGYSVRWRSNADEAEISEIVNELPELVKELKRIESLTKNSEPLKVVYSGEHVGIVELTYNSKKFLDEVRAGITFTTPYHHMLRALHERGGDVVELLDIIAEDVSRERLDQWLKKWITEQLISRKDVIIYHRRPLKKNISLGRAQPSIVTANNGGIRLKLRREMKTKGIYDGLNLRKEEGDYAITSLAENEWHILHDYYNRNGIHKGRYININTPPEIMPNGIITYVDLGIDIVKRSDEGCKLIDSEEFRSLIREGVIRGDIVENIAKEIGEVVLKYCSDLAE